MTNKTYTLELPNFTIEFDRIEVTKYDIGGATALIGHSVDGERMVLTVNVPDYQIQDGEILVPAYSENEGLPEALEKAGIANIFTGIRIGLGVGAIMDIVDEDILAEAQEIA